jgi:prepilin-type N-terminal cleavage/methylation domain-containing protein
MLGKTHKSKNGFTIIEIMIVLAIAGLIMLIVFLAVPALQRSARNTQRKNDAAAIASSIANFIDNNGGSLPTGVGGGTSTSSLLICGATANSETATLGYFTVRKGSTCAAGTSGEVTIAPLVVGTTTVNPTVSANKVVIEPGENCDATGTTAGSTNSRSAAIFYGLESNSSNGYSTQCLEQ